MNFYTWLGYFTYFCMILKISLGFHARVKDIILTFLINFVVSINSSKDFFVFIKKLFVTLDETLHVFIKGKVSLKMMADFIKYKTRMFVVELFDNGKVRDLEDKKYELTYYYHDTQYKIIMKKSIGPRKINKIFSKGTDVTDELRKYMGPFGDFHKTHVTPSMLGYSELTFHCRDKSEKLFKTDDPLDNF